MSGQVKTPAPEVTRILSVDPSLRGTGFAVLEGHGQKIRAITHGLIRSPASRRLSECLRHINEKLTDVIRETRPSACAMEAVIFVQSYRTAITLGSARGAAILAAASAGLPIFEYAPRRVKQAVVGRGGADKQQVAFMIRALLGLTETPSADEADALAVGMTHLQTVASPGRALKPLESI